MEVSKMKRHLMVILLVAFFTPAILYAQDKVEEPGTKLEAFLAKKGEIFIKDSYTIGTINLRLGSLEIDALVIYKPGMENQSLRGLRIEVKQSGRIERTHTSMLDLEEIESLSKAISYMISLAEKWKGGNREAYSEVTFSTKGDFKVGFYQKGAERKIYIISGRISQASCYGELEDLGKLKANVDKGLSMLKEK
jgi:hypothetical protein